jgi:hypothetical protein
MAELGHNQIGAAMNIYAHIMPTAMQETANTMEGILGGLAETKRA